MGEMADLSLEQIDQADEFYLDACEEQQTPQPVDDDGMNIESPYIFFRRPVMASAPTLPPKRSAPPGGTVTPPASKFTISSGVTRDAFRLGVYGPEGIGKSKLASLCPGIVFADLEHSTKDLDVKRVEGIVVGDDYAASWSNLRAWVQSLKSGVYCIDSMTRAEDWCAAYVIKTKKSNNNESASDSIEDFKYKAGLQFVYDEFRRLISDLDNAFLRGVSMVLVAHNRVSRIKNPDGSDFVRHEPRLIDTPTVSNMLQFVQFLDHLLFIDLDKNIDKRGKVQGSGSRTIYLDTAPSRLSKTRSLPMDPMPFDLDENGQPATELWKLLGVEK